jgi:hypothetical protein
MKKIQHHILCITLFCSWAFVGNAQNTDTIITINNDTIKVGNMIIVKKDKRRSVTISTDTVQLGGLQITQSKKEGIKMGQPDSTVVVKINSKGSDINIVRNRNKRTTATPNVSTSLMNWDLGFANYTDNSPSLNYLMANNIPVGNGFMAGPPSSNALKLNNLKSSNVNLWFVTQKVNLYQHIWNVKYGIGLEMFNFRFDQNISFRNTPSNMVYMDNVQFSKNKLFVKYLTVPLQLNFNPSGNKKGFYASLGVSAGYLLKARNKQISAERGKQKYDGNFNLNDWRFATIGEIKISNFSLYGSYGLTNLFDKHETFYNMTPYALGIRLSDF